MPLLLIYSSTNFNILGSSFIVCSQLWWQLLGEKGNTSDLVLATVPMSSLASYVAVVGDPTQSTELMCVWVATVCTTSVFLCYTGGSICCVVRLMLHGLAHLPSCEPKSIALKGHLHLFVGWFSPPFFCFSFGWVFLFLLRGCLPGLFLGVASVVAQYSVR